MKNPLKERLKNGERVYGTWLMTNSFEACEIMAYMQPDFIMIDGEHGPFDIESAGRFVTAIKSQNCVPLLRVPGCEEDILKRGLDTGAYGVMVPLVNTKEIAEKAVKFSKYPPTGVRGSGAGRAAMFSLDPSYYATANDEVLVIVQIEHYTAVENLEEILSVPGIDVAFVGPQDLSMSMGVATKDDPKR